MSFSEHPIEWDDDKISRLWDFYARTPPFSDLYFAKAFGGKVLKASKLPLNRPLEVLDFGCGPGFIWDHLKQLDSSWFYTRVDFSADSVAQVERKARHHERFRNARHVEQLPINFPDRNFDVVLLVEVVEHLDDAHLDSTLVEAARLLKPQGAMVITTPNNEDLGKSMNFCPECGAIFHEWQHVRTWTTGSLVTRLTRHGFSLCFARSLDFAARNLFIRLVMRALGRGPRSPHLISVFQKA